MRTTLTLDDDIAATLNRLRREREVAFRTLVNQALRAGLRDLESPRKHVAQFSTPVADLGRCLLGDIVSGSEALELLEGPLHR